DPFGLTRSCIESLHESDSIGRIERPIDHNGSSLKIVGRTQVRKVVFDERIHRGTGPGNLELREILTINLIERRVPGEGLVAAVSTPLPVGCLAPRADRSYRQHQ